MRGKTIYGIQHSRNVVEDGWLDVYHVSLNQVSVDGTHPVIYVEKLHVQKKKVMHCNVHVQYFSFSHLFKCSRIRRRNR